MPRPLLIAGGVWPARRGPELLLVRTPWIGADLPEDLFEAVCLWLEQYPGLALAFGHTSATPKFLAEPAARGTDPPYLVYSEDSEPLSYQTAGTGYPISAVGEGVFFLSIYASGKTSARTLGRQVASALSDAPLTFADGELLYLRPSNLKFPIVKTIAPGGNVAAYQRLLEFRYIVDRPFP